MAEKRTAPLPSADASWEEQAAYFEKNLPPGSPLMPGEAEEQELARQAMEQRVARRKKREQFNISLSPEELAGFLDYAEKLHMPPSTLARAWLLQRLDQERSAS